MDIKLVTYNSTGLSPLTVKFIQDMIEAEKPDILALQETFTIRSTAHKVDAIHKDYLAHVVCGTDDKKEIMCGRPSGGIALLWKKSLAHCVKIVKPWTIHKRICAINVRIGDDDIIICNAYMPNDNYNNTSVNADFIEVCDQIETLVLRENPKYFILTGDLNVDFRRQNAHSRYMASLMDRLQLFNTWSLSHITPEETYIGPNFSAKSMLDYFLCSDSLQNGVLNVSVIQQDSNMSNHRPVKMTLAIEGEEDRKGVADNYLCDTPRVSWHKVKDYHINHYQQHLDDVLKRLPSK